MTNTDKKILIEQLKHMAYRLLEEGKKIDTEPLIIDYDNGGGQSGVRENPFYPAYEKLITTYTKTLTVAKDLIGEENTEIKNLDSLRAKFKVAK